MHGTISGYWLWVSVLLSLMPWPGTLAQGIVVTHGNNQPLPTLPLRFDLKRRLQLPYVDSVITQTRLTLRYLEGQPRSQFADTLRLDLLRHLAFVYEFKPGQKDSMQRVARQLVELARQWGNVRAELNGLMQESDYYYTHKQDYPQALVTNYQALRLLDRDSTDADRYRWRIQHNLGKLSYRMGKYDESLRFYRAAIRNLTRDRPTTQIQNRAYVLQLMSESFKYLNQLDSAEHCSVLALQLGKEHQFNPVSMAYLHGDLAVVYLHQHRYAESLSQLREAESRWQQLNRPNGLAVTWADMAHIYYLTRQYDQATAYARRALTTDTGIPTTRLLAYEVMALASATKGDWQTAYNHHRQFKATGDSILNRRKLTETLTLQAGFEREKLMLEQQQARQLQEQRYLTLQSETELNEQQLMTRAKEAELQQFQAQADQQRLLQLTRQTDLQRRLETQALKSEAQTRKTQQQTQIKTLQLTELQNRLTLQERTRNFGLALFALVGLSLLGYTQLLRRKNKDLRRANNEIRAAQQHSQTQELTALRAQMNPHFIFNCINSIKLYTLQNNTDKASDYLTKFARLIRLVLENSRADRITLENELEALQLYSDLEAMRFKEKVTIVLVVAPDIDQQFVTIPPLLLQPYVENAIWHGLMHKPDGGTVTVSVSQPTDQLLHIEIVDDGIGRARATALKSKSAGKGKSFGMQVTADRIRMINTLYNTQTSAQILDLVAPDGKPLGTKVVLEIPV